ncbi:melatonin receptor type 1A-A-like [Galleria mellonella]|uniref:Melatonin receptor type 1A-A-like n=1 Tax=Galleria mellonella TaxID=7137 RepID=A0A6J3C1P7_GALME|nr:melatonin receptor type 1A-A-like [Galleria mellonella]XP_031767588.1 melatonin receptor type 1A-A-like [Galleria mellonella]XP_052751467.1 melatonin receptor type 1A-A-like [Galleria mellonella]
MHAVGTVFNGTRYSPVTLSHEWPTLSRLLFMVFCSCLGTTINGFFVAAFFVEHTLKKVGNVFLACIGMADLIVTTGVMPVSAVVLLSAGEWDTIPVCHVLQFLTETSTYCYSLFFTLVAAETYYRLCRTTAEYEMFISMRVGLVAIMVFTISLIIAGLGVYLGLDYDYCQRRHYGNFYFRVTTSVIFHAIPFLMTIFGLVSSCIQVRKRAREQVHYKRSQQYERDYSTTNLNITAFLLYVMAWTPYLVILHEYPSTNDNKFYHCAWIGVCRSVFTSFLYSSMNRNFRRAFAHLFYYCCCKSTLTGSFSNRHRRALEYKSATGDVRVHIMHQAVNASSPQRAASSSRETQEL